MHLSVSYNMYNAMLNLKLIKQNFKFKVEFPWKISLFTLAFMFMACLLAALKFGFNWRAALNFGLCLRAALNFGVCLKAALNFGVRLRAALKFGAY